MAEEVSCFVYKRDSGGYANIVWDEHGNRMEKYMAYDPPRRHQSLCVDKEDVLIVTGGAKGITAECALAFSEKTQASMLLVGSSSCTDKEVEAPIQRFSEKNLPAKYYQCNIADPTQVKEMISQILVQYRHITGVIHGAAKNEINPSQSLVSDLAAAEASPKVLGLHNLCHYLDLAKLKLFVTFTSVIGITGMTKNAVYAHSNEYVASFINSLQHRYPDVHFVSMAFSAWDEVGMAVRLEALRTFRRMGVSPIPRKDGVERFLQLALSCPLDKDLTEVAVVARSKPDKIDTWKIDPCTLHQNNEFFKLSFSVMGVEAIMLCKVELTEFPYLVDHAFTNGAILLPTVLGLEIMAKAIVAIKGDVWFFFLVLNYKFFFQKNSNFCFSVSNI
jgi:NAD(P)-dependent dehydrogenase (short-subunit alcohol dehydrogenase family)